MKLNQIASACLWLPGFAPEEDPNRLSADVQQQLPIAVRAPTSEQQPEKKRVWPRLVTAVHESLAGSVAKFDANLAALRLLRALELDQREPTASEREALNRYTGWGGLPQAFNLKQSDERWKERAQRLKDALSEEEYASAMASTTDAHFTPVSVIDAMWAMVQRMGFGGGRILDPSTGTGYFLGAMPEEIAARSTVTAVEIDSVSARIASKLYRPYGARVLNKGLEASSLPEGHFDLAISNVPFGKLGVAEVRNVPFAKFSIHNYFIARSLELVRPGGIVAVLTSSYTLDSSRKAARAYLAGQADLVAAIRLPAATFESIAGTSVTTDVLLFQKKEAGVGAKASEDWLDTTVVPQGSIINGQPYYSSKHLTANKWFCSRPESVIGKLQQESSAYGLQTVCKFDGDLHQALQDRLAMVPEGVYTARQCAKESDRQHERVETGLRQGLAVVDGQIVEVFGGSTVRLQVTEKVAARIEGMISIREAARSLIAAQCLTTSEALLSVYRTALCVAYDSFVAKWGYLTDRANRSAFKADPDQPLLLSLEVRDEQSKRIEKAAIFTQRTVGAAKVVTRCGSLEEALQVSLAEFGHVRPCRIAELVGVEEDVAMHELEQSGHVFLDPDSLRWVVEDAYLSGNVREKLAIAIASGDRFTSNADALQKVLPVDLTPGEIIPRFGSTWIPTGVYAQFLDELLGKGHRVELNLSVATWSVTSPWEAERSVAATQIHGTVRVPAGTLVELALNQLEPSVFDRDRDGKQVANPSETIAAREKQFQLREKFREWLWKDGERATVLVRLYNDSFNSLVVRRYNGSHLVLPGMSDAFILRPHQKDAVWRAISSDSNLLLAHAVGAGKTLEMICIAMEMRRVGKAAKPMMVVPNHLLSQASDEFVKAYPGAKILMATKDDLVGDRRRIMLSRIAVGDYDCVIITHASFERIQMAPAYMERFIQEEIDRIVNAIRETSEHEGGNRIVKQLARAKKSWETRLKRLSAEGKKDNLLTFDQLGVDALLIDEAHCYKNCFKFTKMQRIAGLPNSDSQRAFDMFVKTRYIAEARGDRSGVVFATATTVSNSMAEIYVMQRFLQERALDVAGVGSFDAWAGNFGESVTALELAPDGSGYRLQTRFASYVNCPELMGIFRQVADIRTAEMLQLPVPKHRMETVVAKGGAALKAYVQGLVKRAEKIRSGGVQPSQDNMLSVTGDGRKAALDMRLVDEMAQDEDGSKINLCVHGVHRTWVESASFKGTQLIFCDQSTPRADGKFSVYTDLRDKLIAKGIPAHEIEFIHDFETDTAKADLFRRVRSGDVRVLVGSTQKLGVGTNVQERLIAIWHLDCPWRPSDLEQRNGRILRQGNICAEVVIYYLVTERSFDTYQYQLNEVKARFIEQIMRGDTSIRSVDDGSDVLTFAEIKALASGNPLVLEKAGVDSELAKLCVYRARWESQRWSNGQEVRDLPRWIASNRQKIERMGCDMRTTASRRLADPFSFTVNGRELVGQDVVAKSLRGLVQKIPPRSGEVELGMHRGLKVMAERSAGGEVDLWLAGAMTYSIKTGRGYASAVEDCVTVTDCLADEVHRLEVKCRDQESRLQDLQAEAARPFEKQARYEELQRRKIELDALLDLSKGDQSAVDESEKSDAETVS